ncbi:MAG: hypothetical protein GEEBNDBF_01749 [bacterium]|nr:hypothetical protein [bacterium]
MSLGYGKFLTPALEQELATLAQKYGYTPGHFHVAFSLAQSFSGRRKQQLRENLEYLIQNPGINQDALEKWLQTQLAESKDAKRYDTFRLKRLEVQNFGPFPELQMEFATSKEQPITLLGAHNGRGKTSLFRAIRAALYGMEPDNFKERSPLYNDGANGSTMRFTLLLEDGESQVSTLTREYHYRLSSARPVQTHETVSLKRGTWVLRDDQVREEIEQFLPSALSGYFFFDADDQIQQFLNNQEGTLRAGIERILGIEQLNELEKQIEALRSQSSKKYKQVTEAKGSVTQKQIQEQLDELEAEQAKLGVAREQALQRLKQSEADLATINADIDKLLTVFDPQLHQEYDQATQRLGALVGEYGQIEEELEKLARESLPLFLIMAEVEDLLGQAQSQRLQSSGSGVAEAISELHTRASQIFRRYSYDEEHLEQIFRPYQSLLQETTAEFGALEYTQQQVRALEELLQQRAGSRRFAEVLSQRGTLLESMESLNRRKNALIPPKTEMAERHKILQADRDRLLREADALRIELRQQEEQQRDLAKQQASLRERAGKDEDFSSDLNALSRLIEQIDAFRSFINDAGKAFRASRVSALEEAATHAYALITNKPDMDRRIVIDPETFAASLHLERKVLSMYSHSAGEQQIIAMALVAGLARTAERGVPMIIDTPLARLDQLHRENLCSHFFPKVAEQVVILSTDSEIIGPLHQLLKPAVGLEYLIDRHAGGKEHSYLREGYF